jgi:uncharacterized protein YecE (DUF72 family)
MAKVHIGTSGWSYQSWRGPFFPKEVMVKDHLRFYATQFDTTELNGVFYRTPTEAAVRGWREQTPDDFLFAWKASKFITHWKRLTPKSKNSLELMESRLKLLGPKAGPVLFQLPPQFKADRDRLASFLKMLSRKRTYAFEFRDKSWYEDDILDLLRDHDISLCLSDHHDAPMDPEGLTRIITPTRHCAPGRVISRNGNASGARFMSISTTTRKAPHRRMHFGSSGCWEWPKRKAARPPSPGSSKRNARR